MASTPLHQVMTLEALRLLQGVYLSAQKCLHLLQDSIMPVLDPTIITIIARLANMVKLTGGTVGEETR